MEPEQTSLGATPTANQSRRIAVLMLVVVVGTCLTLVAMAHSRRVQEWIRDVSWQQAKSKKLIPVFCMHNHFFDARDRLLHEELPSADYSHGGVYFLGASSMMWALRLWDQPASTRTLINNFAMGGFTHADVFDFVRFWWRVKGSWRPGERRHSS